MDNDQFFKMLKDMTNDQLAERLERGGEIFAPNPHFVLEAARRLRARNEDVSRLRSLVKELADAVPYSSPCADCDVDCKYYGDCKVLNRRSLVARAREEVKDGE